ncbi:hypothetical protein ACFL2R_01225 [Patescibacteria group bacterium]
MKSNAIKTILILLGVMIVIGIGVCSWRLTQISEVEIIAQPQVQSEQKKMNKYSSEKYSFEYSPEYSISETGEGKTYILTISRGDVAKLEIFKADEYPGDRAAFGFTGEEASEEAEAYVRGVEMRSAKEYLTISGDQDKYDAWLYYGKDDDKSKKELKEIFDTIVIK